jgi:hypothetical protein
LEREKQSLLAPLSDEEKAVFAAARQLKISISPVEVNERLRLIQNTLGLQGTELLRNRVILEMAREKMADLQVADAVMPANARVLDAETRAQLANAKALAATRAQAANAKALADDIRGRMGFVKNMMLAPVSDEALLAAANQHKISVFPAEVDERVRRYMAQNKLTAETAQLRDQAELDLFREKLALLRNEPAPRPLADQTLMERPQPFTVSQVDGKPVTNYLLRRYFRSNDYSVTATVITPLFGSVSPNSLVKIKAVIDAAMTEATGKVAVGYALMPRVQMSQANTQVASLVQQGVHVALTLDIYGPSYEAWLESNAPGSETSLRRRNDTVMTAIAEAIRKIDAAFTEAKTAPSRL